MEIFLYLILIVHFHHLAGRGNTGNESTALFLEEESRSTGYVPRQARVVDIPILYDKTRYHTRINSMKKQKS